MQLKREPYISPKYVNKRPYDGQGANPVNFGDQSIHWDDPLAPFKQEGKDRSNSWLVHAHEFIDGQRRRNETKREAMTGYVQDLLHQSFGARKYNVINEEKEAVKPPDSPLLPHEYVLHESGSKVHMDMYLTARVAWSQENYENLLLKLGAICDSYAGIHIFREQCFKAEPDGSKRMTFKTSTFSSMDEFWLRFSYTPLGPLAKSRSRIVSCSTIATLSVYTPSYEAGHEERPVSCKVIQSSRVSQKRVMQILNSGTRYRVLPSNKSMYKVSVLFMYNAGTAKELVIEVDSYHSDFPNGSLNLGPTCAFVRVTKRDIKAEQMERAQELLLDFAQITQSFIHLTKI